MSHWLCFVIYFITFGQRMFEIPEFFCSLEVFFKKEKVCSDSCVRAENTIGQTDNRVEIKLREEFLFDSRFNTFSKEESVRKNDSASSSIPQKFHNENKEKVCGLSCFEF